MKFCSKCGKELFDEAVICPSCGEELAEITVPQTGSVGAVKSKKGLNKKLIIIIIMSVVLVVAVVIGAVFLINFIRVGQVKQQLAGKRFEYSELNNYSYTYKIYKFDENSECTVTYLIKSYKSTGEPNSWSMDEPETYDTSYDIKFENGMTFINFGGSSRRYEIQYDKYGRIESLYDITLKELYD